MKAGLPTKTFSRLSTSVLIFICMLMVWNLHHNAVTCPTTATSTSTLSSLEHVNKAYDPSTTADDVLPTNNPLTGFFPGWNNGTFIDRDNLDGPTKTLLPKRMIAVFGLESSGTTFVQNVLAQAVDATRKNEGGTMIAPDAKTRVQHFSLPNGYFPKGDPDYHRQFEPLPIIPVFVSQPCRTTQNDRYKGVKNVQQQPSPPQCHLLYGPVMIPDQGRYFVNITSHINFYRQRGVDTTAVLVVRDPALHFRGITSNHCKNETAAFEQYKTGQAILQHAMNHLDPDSFTVVSYETLMTLKQVYLKEIYKALHIESDYIPEFKNGNIDHVPEALLPPSIAEKLKKDTGFVSNVVIPKNLYEPKSLAEIQKELAKTAT